jgi:cellulose synthase operon protein C
VKLHARPTTLVSPRLLALVLALGFGAGATLVSHDARAELSAGGRKKKGGKPAGGKPSGSKPTGTKPTGTKPSGSKPTGTKPTGTTPTPTPGEDPSATKGPTESVLIARYTAIVLSQPGATFPNQKLAQLYRERDGNLKKLIEEFEKRAADGSSDAWNAKVALAGFFRQDARPKDAIAAYEAAIAEKPKESGPVLALAQLLQDQGDVAGAKERYEAALALLTLAPDKAQTLRTLRTLSLEAKQWDEAAAFHKQLIAVVGNSLFVKEELAKELLARGEAERAEAEYREVVKAAAGDNRALAPALTGLGRALAKEKKNKDALETLKRALAIAGGEAGIRTEILAAITEVYRAEQNLPELIVLLEKEGAGDFQRLIVLGALYEETGAVDKAIATYRKALGQNAKHIDTRLRVIRLLQSQGQLDEAIKENEALLRAAPKNPDFVFQLAETRMQRGDREKAMGLLAKLEQSAGNDVDVLARLADFYERIEEKERAMKLFAKLATMAPSDPSHLVELGDRYWQAGDKKRALETWQRIRTVVSNKARALSAMGEVYLDHDLVTEALDALKEAMEADPKDPRYQKAYAVALERSAAAAGQGGAPSPRFDEAVGIWEKLLESSGQNRLLAREARGHIVTIWSLTKQLEARSEPLKRKLADDPPDLEAGRLLAEVQMRLRKLEAAEVTLVKITDRAPGDEEAFLALERARVMAKNLPGAISALEKLVAINPKRAREYYQRMAQYAAELYQDEDAVRYAAKAMELSPEDADGHKKLGEMYRRRGDLDKAIAELRAAISRNDRLFPVYMELAELLVTKGRADEADQLYRRVVRLAPDEELVAQAGRLSIQRNLAKNTLAELENDLLPLTLGRPNKLIYRRLLVELYGHRTAPLVQKARLGTGPEAEEARAELVKIGARGVKPLLDALSDTQSSQVNTAIEVLAYVENKGAGASLFSFATGTAEQSLRVRAMMATAALRDPALLPRYAELVAPDDLPPSDPVTAAAAWAVARMGDKKALPLLEKMRTSPSPDVRAFSALGLGVSGEKKLAPKLEEMIKAADGSPSGRAAAALSLGALLGPAAAPELEGLAHGDEPLVRSAAVIALAATGDRRGVAAALPLLFSEDTNERKSAAAALVYLAGAEKPKPLALPVQIASSDSRAVVADLLPDLPKGPALAKALLAFDKDLAEAARVAAGTSAEQALRVADALGAGASGDTKTGGALATTATFAPFTDDLTGLSETERAAVSRAAEGVAKAAIPRLLPLTRHPVSAVKMRVLRALSGRSNEGVEEALAAALTDQDEGVVRAALAALASLPQSQGTSLPAVTRLLGSSTSWSIRVAAAETAGTLASARAPGGGGREEAWSALAKAAENDDFAFVRQAALTSLAGSGAPAAKTVAQARLTKDPDAHVRETAQAIVAR